MADQPPAVAPGKPPTAAALLSLAHGALLAHMDRDDPAHARRNLLIDLSHLMGRQATLVETLLIDAPAHGDDGALLLPLQHLDQNLGTLCLRPGGDLAAEATARALGCVSHTLAVLLRHEATRRVASDAPLLQGGPGQLMRAALRGAGTFVWEWDIASDRLGDIDEGFEQLGYAPIAGRRTQQDWDALIHPEDRAANHAAYLRHASGQADFYEHVYRARAADGQWRWLQERGRIVERSADGEPLRMVGTQTDITERLQIEQARTSAEAANQAKSELLSRVSHELRTPLNAVLGFTQLLVLDKADPLSERQAKRMSLVQQSGEHLLALIDDLLDLTSIDAGRLPLKLQAVTLAPLAQDTLTMAQTACGDQALHLQCKAEPDVTAQADRQRLRQVLLNLLSNAIKYNQPGGSVQLLVDQFEGMARMQVIDTGPGLTADECAHLFEPFNRLSHANSSIEGTGIGLTVTQALVALMHGRIQVSSTPGQGSNFTVLLPLASA
jgi:signal transduction histidine kinase